MERQGFTGDGRPYRHPLDFNATEGAVYAIDVATGAARRSRRNRGGHPRQRRHAGRPPVALTFETAAGTKQAGDFRRRDPHDRPEAPTPGSRSPAASRRTAGPCFSSNVDGRLSLFAYAVTPGTSAELPLPDGLNDGGRPANASFSPDGTRLLLTHQSSNTPFDLWVHDLAARKARPITRLGLASIDPPRLPSAQIVHYPSSTASHLRVSLMPFNLKRDGTNPACRAAARRPDRPGRRQLLAPRHRAGFARLHR